MQKLTLDDIHNNYDYEHLRDQWYKTVNQAYKVRRIQLGPHLVLTFLNRDILTYQVQELTWAERLVEDEEIQSELDVYNEILPDKNELSTTMFLEIPRKEDIKAILRIFTGLTAGEKLWFEFKDGLKIPAQFDHRTPGDTISSVHYAKFRFDEMGKTKLLDISKPLQLVIAQKSYHYAIAVNEDLRYSLVADITGEEK